MPQLPNGIRRVFRLAVRSPGVADDVGAEIAFHLHMRTEELVARGWAPDAARAEALRRFGDIQRWSEAMSETDRRRETHERRAAWGEAVAQDLRHTLRGLRRQPGFTAGVVLTMALGIGANATMFGIVDRLLLRAPAHVVDADRVRRVYFVDNAASSGTVEPSPTVSYAQFTALRDSVRAFSQLAVMNIRREVFGKGADAREIPMGLVSAELFPLLGVHPYVGRFFTAEEDRPPAGSAVAVLGFDLWQREFGGDRAVLGRTVRVRQRDYAVIGVAPPGFSGADLGRVDVWLPVSAVGDDIIGPYLRLADTTGTQQWHQVRNVGWLELLGRLAPGVDDARANAELTTRHRRWLAAAPTPPPAAELARRRPMAAVGPIQRERGPLRSDDARVATWLAGVSLLVLLIACANVTNLLLARALRRRREIAVRVALGIGRGRLITQLVLESVLLALFGGAAALLVAHWGSGLVRKVLLPDVAWTETLADVRVFAFTAIAALLTGLLAGIAPARQASERDLTGALKAGVREGGGHRSRTRTVLLVAQAALSVVLLAGAGFFVRSLHNVTSADLGFDAAQVLDVPINLRDAGYTEREAEALSERLYEHLRTLPGVASASLAVTTPFQTRINIDLRVPGWDSIPELPSGPPLLNAVTPDYFRTMGTRIIRGRGFGDGDRFGAPRVIVVNETMARVIWPGQNALGKCVRLGLSDTIPCSEVVGIAEAVRWGEIRPEPAMEYYVPLAQRQWDGPFRALFVRPAGDPAAMVGTVRREVLALAPRLRLVDVQLLQEYVEPSVRPWRLGASVFTAFGALALVLAAVGLYSVLAYMVAQRSHELGVRIALGASTADVLRLVVGAGLRVTAAGTAIGLVVALYAGRSVEEMLYGVTAHDPLVLGVVAGTLLLVAAVASFAPAWRAARVDPNVALRAE